MTSDSAKDRHNAAAQIEESIIAGIRHKDSATQGKKLALLAAVTGLAAAIVGVAGKPPWDFGALELTAFLVFIAGGILPGLYSVFARTAEEEGRLTSSASELSLEDLAALRYQISFDARLGADIRLARGQPSLLAMGHNRIGITGLCYTSIGRKCLHHRRRQQWARQNDRHDNNHPRSVNQQSKSPTLLWLKETPGLEIRTITNGRP